MQSGVIRQSWFVAIGMLAFVCILLSSLIPPFMSPDEVDHVKRAYWLSQGHVILDTEEGQNSGGQVDTGLTQYMNSYYLTFMKDRNHKVTASEVAEAPSMQWSGQSVYSPAPGTGYYLPLAYAPQAVALGFGKLAGLSVDTSYRLARLFSLIAALVILLVAISIYEINPLAAALLILPMSLFQLSSASLDGITNALAVLAISLFMRVSVDREDSNRWLAPLLGITLFVLVTSRAHLLPMLFLPFICYAYSRDNRTLVVAALSVVAVFGWLALAAHYTVDHRMVTGTPVGQIVKHYVFHPFDFFGVVYETLSSPIIRNFYSVAFIGNLGWLDTPIFPGAYTKLCWLLLIALLVSLKLSNFKENRLARLAMAGCAILSIFMVFFALLVTYNEFPAETIQGVQGRYFLVPALMISYALALSLKERSQIRRLGWYLVLCVFLTYSTYSTMKLVTSKYYIVESVAR